MDCDIPIDYRCSTVVSTSFVKVNSLFDSVDFNKGLTSKCAILLTKSSNLVEICDNEVVRIANLSFSFPKKIIVHHEFEPLKLYVVILQSNSNCILYDYQNLKVLSQWKDIKDAISDDFDCSGKPALRLQRHNGSQLTINCNMSQYGNEITDGQLSATVAMVNKLQVSQFRCHEVQSELQMKEIFISKQLSQLVELFPEDKTEKLQNFNDSNIMNHRNDEALQGIENSNPVLGRDGHLTISQRAGLKVVSFRHRLVHDQWVLCIKILNTTNDCSVCDPSLILNVDGETDGLRYKSKMLQAVQRRPRQDIYRGNTNEISIEPLVPPIIKPKKSGLLFGICSLPNFKRDLVVICNGLITYSLKSSKDDEQEVSKAGQVSLSSLSLHAGQLTSVTAKPLQEQPNSGLSMDFLCLIAASIKNEVILKSLVSSLTNLEGIILEKKFAHKIPSAPNYLCCVGSELLRNVAFSLMRQTAHEIKLTVFARDNQQFCVFNASLLAMLPMDIEFLPIAAGNESLTKHDKVISTMVDCLQHMLDGKAEKNFTEFLHLQHQLDRLVVNVRNCM